MSRAWQPAGDSAWVAVDGAAGAATMHALASAVRAANLPGVRDAVPSVDRVTVHLDPLRSGLAAVARLQEIAPAPRAGSGRLVEIPVAYDGEDLATVASLTGLSPEDVVRRHAARDLPVLMTGFAPGFPYLAGVDPRLTLPRREVPRVRVPAGAVGLAAGMSCIYPGGTAGGWHLIGHADITLFDPRADPPAALSPGDRVRWVPVDRLSRASHARTDDAGAGETRGSGGLTVLRAGPLTTVQDAGRWGFQHLGVPVSGSCDAGARRRANAAAGNPESAAVLEMTQVGADVRFEQDAIIAWAGADLDIEIDGYAPRAAVPAVVRRGTVVRCGAVRAGFRSYLAVAGGLAVTPILGSRSACLAAGFGGGAGRPLAAGDWLGIGRPEGDPRTPHRWFEGARVAGATEVELRVLPGVDAGCFSAGDAERLLGRPLRVSPHINRAGLRLVGGAALLAGSDPGRLPVGTVPGAVQITPDGTLLLLLADRQPTGGYPQIWSVISADLDRAAQLSPGDSVTFRACTHADALSALVAQEARVLNGV